ncbi:MAG: thioesterase domain-containing protein [Archangium sp.]
MVSAGARLPQTGCSQPTTHTSAGNRPASCGHSLNGLTGSRLGGSSFGGIIAYARAQRLALQGERVERVFLLDSPGPRRMPKALHTDAQIVEYLDRMAPELFQPVLLHGSNREAALPEREVYFRLFRNNAEAMLRYAPEPSIGRVVFLRASERDETTPHHSKYAWIALVRGGIPWQPPLPQAPESEHPPCQESLGLRPRPGKLGTERSAAQAVPEAPLGAGSLAQLRQRTWS